MDLSTPHSIGSRVPPPQYTEKKPQTKSRVIEPQNYGNGQWVVRRTSFTIESSPVNDSRVSQQVDGLSMSSSAKSDEKRRLRNVLARWGNQQAEENQSDVRSIDATSARLDASSQYGTTVSIEAGCSSKPRVQRHHEMKGLEQAASMARWPGSGKPADAWGKLAKDPELWDDAGDTLVYFGYQRPQASFRIKSSVFEETKSDILTGKLRDGYRAVTKSSSVYSPSTLRGIKDLSLCECRKHSAPLADSAEPAYVQYEIHFPAPENVSRMDLLRYHTTTRNFIALLKDKPLVGMTYFQALMDLFERIKLYMPRDCNPCKMLVKYLLRNKFHNISNDPGAAAGLLAWSEDVEVRWKEGWREAFVHCTGMYAQVQSRPEYRDISNTTCVLLNHAHMELQARIQEVEHRLSTFNFNDLWGSGAAVVSDARKSYDRFHQALTAHYEAQHKHWPPRAGQGDGGGWLSRPLVGQLQRDFAALYDAYVDRNSEGLGLSVGIKCDRTCIANSDDRNGGEHGLQITKFLAAWDHKHKHAHFPRPLPVLPAPSAIDNKAKHAKPGFFSSKSKALEKQAIQAYENSRIMGLPARTSSNPLVERFRQLEKTDHPGELDPREARKGRWMLVYGALQVLATILVDTPHLYFKDNVSYFLNPRLKGTPPWELAKDHAFEEASSLDSHCWTIGISDLKPGDTAPRLELSPIG